MKEQVKRLGLVILILMCLAVAIPLFAAAIALVVALTGMVAYAALGWGGYLLGNADTSCHNVMRGFKTSAPSVTSVTFEIEMDEIQTLEELTREFANRNGWSFVSDRYRPYGSEFSFSACTEPGVTIKISEYSFTRGGDFVHPAQWSGVANISLYLEDESYDWRPEYLDLVEHVDARWPVQRHDRIGRPVDSLEETLRHPFPHPPPSPISPSHER